MRFFEWNNNVLVDCDIFAVFDKAEKDNMVSFYKNTLAESVSFPEEGSYYYFINSNNKTITPMPKLNFAFGGQYNGYPPYGEEIINFKFDITEYELTLYERR